MMWRLEDLTSGAVLARKFKVTRAAVGMWAARYPGFPTPLVYIGTMPVYSATLVYAWYRRFYGIHHRLRAQRTMWELADLTSGSVLARAFTVTPQAINMWAVRYGDFPAPLVYVGNIPLYSDMQVRDWRTTHAYHLGEFS